ncbi:MAG: creatininase family protein [Geminicoccaceae bacterium]|nr:creatininase family protein [Geminicoccaceae bacterium]
MLLERCTWQEVERYLEHARGIILPVGSTEQHGPTGLIGTDALCAELIARGVGEATGALVAPTLNFGMAQHHMGFCGTMTLRPQTLLAVLVDLLGSLAQHGFERCLVINGHGGNMATIMAGQHGDDHGGVLRAARPRQPGGDSPLAEPALPPAHLVEPAGGDAGAKGALRRA